MTTNDNINFKQRMWTTMCKYKLHSLAYLFTSTCNHLQHIKLLQTERVHTTTRILTAASVIT